MLKDLKEGGKPLIEQIKMPVDMQKGQFPSILHLTTAGAELLKQELRYAAHEIRYPKSRAKVFTQYHHKVATVEAHIQFRQRSQRHDVDAFMFETYFDMEKRGSNFTSRTQFAINAEEIVIPDAVALCFDGWQEHLIVIEIYNGHDIGRTITQLKKHLIGLANLAAAKTFESE